MLSGQAIRGVALGVGVTAIVQAVIGGIGLAIAGVPFAALLTAVMFILCIVQLGPIAVLGSATIWVFWNGSTGWGLFLLVWTLTVGIMDNFLRPVLIRRGATCRSCSSSPASSAGCSASDWSASSSGP